VEELKKEITKLKRESSRKIKEFESQVKIQVEDIERKGKEIEGLKAELQRRDRLLKESRKVLFRIKKESSSRISTLELKVKKVLEELRKRRIFRRERSSLIKGKRSLFD